MLHKEGKQWANIFVLFMCTLVLKRLRDRVSRDIEEAFNIQIRGMSVSVHTLFICSAAKWISHGCTNKVLYDLS